MVDRAQLKQRPAELDYRVHIEQRILRHKSTHMIQMNAIGIQTGPRKPYEVVERVAIIYIQGVLVNEAYWWDETEYAEIQHDVQFALDDADVDGIILSIASPGGETDNVYETADLIAEAGKTKPVWAVADPYAYSAAYMLASQAKRIFVPEITGGVGSIGVYTLHWDYSEMLKKAGVTVTPVSAGKGKLERSPYAPLSDTAKARIEKEVTRLYGEFTLRVARGRKMEQSAVVDLGAYLYEGPENALGANLADQTGSTKKATKVLAARVVKLTTGGFALTNSEIDFEVEGGPMSADNKQPANAPPTPAPAPAAAPASASAPTNPTNNETAVQEAKAAGYSSATEVVELCTLAGKPALAAEFLRKQTPVADVRRALLDSKAEASDQPGETAAGVLPFQGKEVTAKPAKSNAELMRERHKQGAVN